jgi:3-oxoacyl-(acyl-carrier-protein) synthase
MASTTIEGPKFNPFFIPKMISDITAGQISIHFGFHGPNYVTTSACASSFHALADAFNLLRLGKADVILAGGAEAAITRVWSWWIQRHEGSCLRATTILSMPAVRSAPAATASSWVRVLLAHS